MSKKLITDESRTAYLNRFKKMQELGFTEKGDELFRSTLVAESEQIDNLHVKAKINNLEIENDAPKDLGGKNSWENTVCSCFACNNKKENKTPSQANMSLRRQPYCPTIMEFLLRKIKQEGLAEVLKELEVY